MASLVFTGGFMVLFVAISVALYRNPRPMSAGPSSARLHREPMDEDTLLVSPQRFYNQYHGHPTRDLAILHRHLHSQHKRIVWLAGDSSLDNKHWLGTLASKLFRNATLVVTPPVKLIDVSPLPLALRGAFEEPKSGLEDVAFWLNSEFDGSPFSALNCAVEESTLFDRTTTLLAHDEFVREHMRRNDVLIVSVGGNDIGLNPSLRTIVSLFILVRLTPMWLLERLPAWLLGNMQDLFGTQVQRYIERLVTHQVPETILVCMYYYPCTKGAGWPDRTLAALGYDASPERLQRAIDVIFRRVTSHIRIEGATVVPVQLSHVLDHNDAMDYRDRVEPSSQGGHKMAQHFRRVVERCENGGV